jgi:alpha-tubulin suppressor-like RCC1 family protein
LSSYGEVGALWSWGCGAGGRLGHNCHELINNDDRDMLGMS